MGALLKLLPYLLKGSQLFNNVLGQFIPAYRANAKTDGPAGVVGGAAAGIATVYAWATGLDAVTAAGLIGGAGYVGIQAGGLLQHWLDTRAAQRKAEAKERFDAAMAEHSGAYLAPSEPPAEVNFTTRVYQWQDADSGDWHKPAGKRCSTVALCAAEGHTRVQFVEDGPVYDIVKGEFV
jgi:hypothetical protein